MTLQTRAWVTAAVLVVLAVAGEFVGEARRRILRREVPDAAPPPLLPGQVLVTVKGPDGRRVPQAVVAQISYSATAWTGSRRFPGMGAGFVVLGPPEGEEGVRRLEISGAADSADEPLPFGALLTDPVPEGATAIEVVLPPERAISGSFRRGSFPVAGVKVKARISYPVEFAFLAGTGADIWHSVQVSDEEGRFRLGQLGAGPQEVSFQCPAGTGMADRIVESGATLDIDWDAGTAHTVTVADRSGNPLANALVVLESPPDSRGSRRARAKGITDRNGKLRFHGLDPATRYRLLATRPGAAPGSPGESFDWAPSDVTVSFRNQRSIWIRVLDEKGAPHDGVAVTARPVEEGRPGASGRTGLDGRCTLHGLDAGPLTVTARDVCAFGAPESATMTREVAEKEREAVLVMARGRSVIVRRGDGGPWSDGVRAVLREEGSNAASVGVLRAGTFSWHGVDPASSYAAVLVDAGRGMAARLDGIRPAVPPTGVVLWPAESLKVSVRWPEGAGDRAVWASWGTQSAGHGTAQPDGSWRIRCLPRGKFLVCASCTIPGRKEPAFAWVEAEAGGEATIEVR